MELLLPQQQKQKIKEKARKLRPALKKQVNKILLFETMGAIIFAFGVCVTQYTHPISRKTINPFWNFLICSFYFFAISISGIFTGGHINPVVTVGLAFHDRIDKVDRNNQNKIKSARILLLYIASQIFGSLLGTTLYFLFFRQTTEIYKSDPSWKQVLMDSVSQMFGSFIFIFGILLVHKSNYVKGQPFKYFYIGLILLVAKMFTFRKGCINPAIALVFQIFSAFHYDNFNLFVMAFPIIVGQLIGGCIAVIFYSKFYDPLTRELQKNP